MEKVKTILLEALKICNKESVITQFMNEACKELLRVASRLREYRPRIGYKYITLE